MPVAILGGPAFDVTTVDPATVLLSGVPPVALGLRGRRGSGGRQTRDLRQLYYGRGGRLSRSRAACRPAALAAVFGGVGDGACLLVDIRGNLTPAQGGGPFRAPTCCASSAGSRTGAPGARR